MCCSVQREGHSSREQATSCPAASEIPAPKPPRLDSDQTTNTHTHSQAHKVNLNTYTPQNSSSEYVTRLVRLNTTHLVLAYCSCLPQIPKQTQVYTLIHITHINTAHTHTHRNSHPLGVLLDSSSSDAREALAWEKETQSCVTFIHSTHTHTVRESLFAEPEVKP